MGKKKEARQSALEALKTMPPADLLVSPLDYVFADHFRQRVLCRVLEEIAGAKKWDQELAVAALQFIAADIKPHIEDEEEDLFPILKERAKEEDNIEELLNELSQEHAADDIDAKQISNGLNLAIEDNGRKGIPKKLCNLLRRFAANEKRHLIVENAIVLPLAKARFTPDDLHHIGRRMAARRGLEFPENIDAE